MGDAILSVRINEELKDKFVTLAQSSGINNKEFMEQLVSVYELNNTAASKNTYSSDIAELQELTKRINNIYLNMIEKSQIKESEAVNVHKEMLKERDSLEESLKEEIQALKDKLEKSRAYKKEVDAQKKEIEKLKEDVDVGKNYNKILKEKLEQKDAELINSKDKISRFDDILSSKTELEEKIRQRDIEISNLTFQLDSERLQIEKLKEEGSKASDELKERLEFKMMFELQKKDLEMSDLKISSMKELDDKVRRVEEEFTLKLKNLEDENATLKEQLLKNTK